VREPLIPRIHTPLVEKKKPLSALLNSASAPQLTVSIPEPPQVNQKSVSPLLYLPRGHSPRNVKPLPAKPAATTTVSAMDHPSPTSRLTPAAGAVAGTNNTTRPRLPHQPSFKPPPPSACAPGTAGTVTVDPKKQQRAGAGTMVEAGVGMDGFIEGCVRASPLILRSPPISLSLTN
jgi:hypothetical protein